MDIKKFFSDHKDTISGLGFIAGLIALGITIYQVRSANDTLRATNAYSIQKDARELVSELSDDANFRSYVLGNDPSKTYPDDVKRAAEPQIGRLLNFYLAVYRQDKAGGISSDIAKSFGKDFCSTLKKYKIIGDYWDRRLKDGILDAEDREMKDAWCK